MLYIFFSVTYNKYFDKVLTNSILNSKFMK